MIRSFDIFDTCLTRRLAEPYEVFDLMAKRRGLGKHFWFNRMEAEREAMRRHGDATLAEIYAILGGWMGWDSPQRDEMMAAELEEEERQLIPVPQIRQHLEESRAAGARVVFLSDMYLPSTFLIERLREHGFHQEGDMLLVSCEARKSKSSGRLFEEAAKFIGKQDWEHIGNHMKADVKGAERAGLKGCHFPEGNLTSHESRLLSWSKEGAPIGSAWAAAARQARIALGRLNRYELAIAAVSAGVAAPLLTAYVIWLCQRAVKLGLGRLYFLARDGHIIRDLFVEVARAEGLTIEARYLYASRIAFRFPRRFPMSEEEAAGVFQANDTIPVSVVAHRLGVAEQLLRRMLPESCRSAASISKDKIPACRESLGAADSCAILNHIALQRSKVLEDYFRQEGLMEDNNYGIVDLGWAGSLQSGIQKTLAHAGCSFRIRGFYLGLWGNTPADLDAEAYAFDYRGCETPPVSWFVSLAELFSQANHGSTLGFKSNEQGFIAPILDEIDSDNLLVPGWLEIHRRVVLSFMSIVISSNAFTITPSSLVRLLRCHLQRYYFFPSKTEAEAWGACRFSSHGVASSREPIAPFPKTLRDMLWIIGIQRFGTGNAIWPHAAAARLPRPLAECARLIHRVLFHMRAVYW